MFFPLSYDRNARSKVIQSLPVCPQLLGIPLTDTARNRVVIPIQRERNSPMFWILVETDSSEKFYGHHKPAGLKKIIKNELSYLNRHNILDSFSQEIKMFSCSLHGS